RGFFFNPNKVRVNYMMLTNLLLFLILVTLLSYYLIPWENFTKSPFKVLIKFWFKVFFSLIIILGVIGFISHNFFI
ncbi:MAG: hypothetical protein ACO3PH_01815, partial [Pelagibacteraceae bacterium]